MSCSPDNRTTPLRPLKWYKKLATEKGRLEAGAFLVEGDKAIRQIINSRPTEISEIVTAKDLPDVYRSYPIRFVSDSQFHSICSTRTPQGPIAVVNLPLDTYSAKLPENMGARVLLLEGIQDPGNAGTLIRTAAAFSYSGVILSDKTADPFSPKCVQSTSGTVLALWIRRTARYAELVSALRSRGFSLVSADLAGSEDPSVLGGSGALLLALGNEASGLSKHILDTSDHRFKIAVAQKEAESLNVSACGAICMYLSSLTRGK